MKRFLALAIVFFVVMGSVAYAAEEAVGFKDINLGSDYSELQKNARFKCEQSRGGILSDTDCRLNRSEKETIAEAPVSSMFLGFYSEKLWRITVNFKSGWFQIVTDALSEKYGKGKSDTRKEKDLKGKDVIVETVTWKKGDCTIEARKGELGGDSSGVSFFTNSGDAIFKQRKAAQPKKNAKDL